jgi:hypothetical protein
VLEEEIENEVDPFSEYTVKDHSNTICEHFYCEDEKQDPNSELLSVRCIKCPSGCNIDPKLFKVLDGKIVKC